MNSETLSIAKVIQKPPHLRTKEELNTILPFLTTRSELLNGLKHDVLYELVKHCRLQKCKKNDVIIKQSTIGDCFYIILTGQTSVYIDTAKSDDVMEDGASMEKRNELETFFEDLDHLLGIIPKSKEVREKEYDQYERSSLGKFIMIIESGRSFGEVALLSENAERNASVVADTDGMDLLVVDRELYDRTVKERQMAEYKDKRDFINAHPLFRNWGSRLQRLLEMSMTKKSFSFDNIIAQQGQQYDGLYFVISGNTKLVIDSHKHKRQYPRLMVNMRSAEKHRLAQNIVHIKRRYGYAEAEKIVHQRLIDVACLGVGDTFGDLEAVTQLNSYIGTLKCASQVTVLHLNLKNFDRLVVKKNPRTMELFREITFLRFTDIMRTKTGEMIPLLKAIYDKFIHEDEPIEVTPKVKPKDKHDKDFITTHLLQLFTEGKMQLFEPFVPDSVYFRCRSIERRKHTLSARERILKELRDNSVNGKLRSLHEIRKKALTGNGRRPRSRRELNELTLEDLSSQHELADRKYADYAPSADPDTPPISHQRIRPVTSIGLRRRSQTLTSTRTGSEVLESQTGESDSNDSYSGSAAYSRSAYLSRQSSEFNGSHTTLNSSPTRSPDVGSQGEKTAEVAGEDSVFQEEERTTSLGSSTLVTFFNVMQTIEKRRQLSQSRPGSAPSQFYTISGESVVDDQSDYVDADSSNKVLGALEQRLRNFHQKLILKNDAGAIDKARVTRLKRCNSLNGSQPPIAGGTVYVKMKSCTKGKGDDHCHVKRYILPKLQTY